MNCSEETSGRIRALSGCCRGCDVKWTENSDGRCNKCRCCGECCGNKRVHNSCGQRYAGMSYATKQRSDRAREARQAKEADFKVFPEDRE